MKDPYEVIKARHVTEKATVLEQLHTSESNRSLAKCDSPKYVFVVNIHANKSEIASAVEEIYKEQKVKVTKVNTITVKPKAKRRKRKAKRVRLSAYMSGGLDRKDGLG